MLGGWVNPHREQQTIPQGQPSSPPKSFFTPTAKARPDQAALATSAEGLTRAEAGSRVNPSLYATPTARGEDSDDLCAFRERCARPLLSKCSEAMGAGWLALLADALPPTAGFYPFFKRLSPGDFLRHSPGQSVSRTPTPTAVTV